MGQEIVYCFKCQKRILGADYAKGLAFQLEHNSCCSACALGVLETLPPKQKEQLLARMVTSTKDRQTSTTSIPKVGSTPPPRKIVIVGDQRPAANPGLLIGLGVGVVALIVVAVIALQPSAPPPPTVTAPPVPVKRPPPDPGLSPEQKRKDDRAREAIRQAREFELKSPRELQGQVKRWREAALEALGTGFEAEAAREVKKAEARVEEAQAKALADLEQQLRDLAARKNFKAAFDALAQARLRHPAATIERLDQVVRDQASAAYEELKAKAIAARDRAAKAEVDGARSEIAAWGVAEYVAKFDAALQAAWTPLFDGKSTSFLSEPSRAWWVLEDGALTHEAKPDAQSGQSRESYGDGEFRFRFSVRGVGQFYLGVRQSGGGVWRVSVDGNEIRKLGDGDHELILTCRGTQVSATMDGNPQAVNTQGKVEAKGRIQFNSRDGVFRLLSVDYRPLP